MGNTIYSRQLYPGEAPAKVYIERKNIKGLRMRWNVKYEAFFVSAPLMISDEKVHQFIDSNQEWMRNVKAEHEAKKQPDIDFNDPDLRRHIVDFVSETFEKWERALGVNCTGVKFRRMSSRWGVCNTRTRRITLAIGIMRLSDELISYIILHELTHLIHADHSPAFWATIERHMPDYKCHRTALKNHLPY